MLVNTTEIKLPSQIGEKLTKSVFFFLPFAFYFGPRKRVAKFCDRVGDNALALSIAAIKKA